MINIKLKVLDVIPFKEYSFPNEVTGYVFPEKENEHFTIRIKAGDMKTSPALYILQLKDVLIEISKALKVPLHKMILEFTSIEFLINVEKESKVYLDAILGLPIDNIEDWNSFVHLVYPKFYLDVLNESHYIDSKGAQFLRSLNQNLVGVALTVQDWKFIFEDELFAADLLGDFVWKKVSSFLENISRDMDREGYLISSFFANIKNEFDSMIRFNLICVN